MKTRDNMKLICTDDRIILKWISKKWVWKALTSVIWIWE
jgi:hypothetical protein